MTNGNLDTLKDRKISVLLCEQGKRQKNETVRPVKFDQNLATAEFLKTIYHPLDCRIILFSIDT